MIVKKFVAWLRALSNMWDGLQYGLLKRIAPREPGYLSGKVYEGKSKLRMLFGEGILQEFRGKTVIDFGCGDGHECIELARNGAQRVIGIDNRVQALGRARRNAAIAGVERLCTFCISSNQRAGAAISLDGFEHFADPESVLSKIHKLLAPGGVLYASFGPTWFHPLGGHLFSVFPWAHLLFSERALIRWRSDLRSDGATRFGEVEGGLNQITIRKFERLLKAGPFVIESLETRPIRRLRLLHNRLTREFTTSVVRCKLVKPACCREAQVPDIDDNASLATSATPLVPVKVTSLDLTEKHIRVVD